MATITTGGLASGLDTNSIIDKLVQIESQQIALLQQQQTGVRSQVSALGDLASKLGALQTAAQALSDSGALGVKSTSSNTTFSAAATSSALPGSFSVNVQQLATNARSRSQAFATDAIRGGTLSLSVRGTSYQVTVQDGVTLAEAAYAIRQSGAPVSANVLDDGLGNKVLSITARDSGYPQTGLPSAALGIAFNATGALGTAPAFTTTDAQNAHLVVDGLTFERTSNTVADVVPGASLTLSSVSAGVTPPALPGGDPSGGTAETLTLATDATTTQTKLKGFVDAYNALMSAVQRQLNVSQSADRGASLAGDSTVRNLQGRLQALISSSATGAPNGIRSLADLGVKTGRDGTLSIDSTTLSSALGKDASAVNAIFSTSGTGMAAVMSAMSTTFTRSGDGLLTVRQDNLNSQIKRLTDSMTAQQKRVEVYRQTLVKQFTAMENVVSQMKSMGSFLSGM